MQQSPATANQSSSARSQAPPLGVESTEIRNTDPGTASRASTPKADSKPSTGEENSKPSKTEAKQSTKTYNAALAEALEDAELPVGWEGQALTATRKLIGLGPAKSPALRKASREDQKQKAPDTNEQKPAPPVGFDQLGRLPGWLMLIVGYLLTALAASLGSPFWFDMLNRFVNIRSAMKPSAPPRTGGPSPKP